MVFCPALWQVQPFFTSFSCSLPVEDGSLTACSQKNQKKSGETLTAILKFCFAYSNTCAQLTGEIQTT